MLGVYDHPHDPEVQFLRSTSVGDGFPADAARGLTSAVAKVDKLLDALVPDIPGG